MGLLRRMMSKHFPMNGTKIEEDMMLNSLLFAVCNKKADLIDSSPLYFCLLNFYSAFSAFSVSTGVVASATGVSAVAFFFPPLRVDLVFLVVVSFNIASL